MPGRRVQSDGGHTPSDSAMAMAMEPMAIDYQVLADAILAVHAVFVLFVIFGLIAVVLGGIARWSWVRNPWFRFGHLLGIGIVVGQAWGGVICPLTTLERWLRERAGGASYAGSFVQHWLQRFLYYDAPEWVFIVAYSTFGLVVLLTLLLIPPRIGRKPPGNQ